MELKPGWLRRQFDALKPFLCLRCGETFKDEHKCPYSWQPARIDNPPWGKPGQGAKL